MAIWTTESPREDGYYWFRSSDTDTPRVVWLWEGDVFFFDAGFDRIENVWGQWSKRIELEG